MDADFDILMSWFPTATDIERWGGPEFEFPFTGASFRRDCHWPDMASYSQRDSSGDLLAFGQFYNRDGHINLARIGVRPDVRGHGIGRQFVSRLMAAGYEELQLPAFSLYVYRDNQAALRCYRSLGFSVRPYPERDQLADVCYYMIRPAAGDTNANTNDNKKGERR